MAHVQDIRTAIPRRPSPYEAGTLPLPVTFFPSPVAALRAFEDAADKLHLGVSAHSVIVEAWMNHPCPLWVQVPGSGMLAVNRAYEHFYGIKQTDYPGTKNQEWWDSQESAQYDANDLKVIETGRPKYFIERMFNRVLDRPEDLLVIKSPLVLEDGRDAVIGEVVSERSPLRYWGNTHAGSE